MKKVNLNKITKTNTESFGGRLRAIRILNGLTQRELSISLGLKSTGAIAVYETDRSYPGVNILQKIATAIPSVDLHWLITGKERISPSMEVSLISEIQRYNLNIHEFSVPSVAKTKSAESVKSVVSEKINAQ